jgi:hypothetical protein
VVIRAASEPAPGSVSAKAPMVRPLASSGSHRSRTSGRAKNSIAFDPM